MLPLLPPPPPPPPYGLSLVHAVLLMLWQHCRSSFTSTDLSCRQCSAARRVAAAMPAAALTAAAAQLGSSQQCTAHAPSSLLLCSFACCCRPERQVLLTAGYTLALVATLVLLAKSK